MYIVGHYVTTQLSQRFSPASLRGPGCVALFLPDFARCHSWGYANCFSLREDTVSHALIKAHMLGDWWVHYGASQIEKRRGWAYKKMEVFARRYREFFEAAASSGLLTSGTSQDSVRGFSHTMMEYCIDTHLAATLPSSDFEGLKKWLSCLGSESENWSLPSIRRLLSEAAVSGESGTLADDLVSFRDRAIRSATPQEFAYRAGVKKFNLKDCSESIELVRRTIDAGMGEMQPGDLDQVTQFTARFIAQHISEAP